MLISIRSAFFYPRLSFLVKTNYVSIGLTLHNNENRRRVFKKSGKNHWTINQLAWQL
jgi:hypothetical protein